MFEFNFGPHGLQFPLKDMMHTHFVERIEARLEARLEEFGALLHGFGGSEFPPLQHPGASFVPHQDVLDHVVPPHAPIDPHLFG